MSAISSKEWRKKNPDKRNVLRKRNYAKNRKNTHRMYQHYSNAEDESILQHVVSDAELAKQIGRSVQAIQIRRVRLKSRKID